VEHWKEPEPLAGAQRVGYSSPVISGLGQEAAASVNAAAPVVHPANGAPVGHERVPRRRSIGPRYHQALALKRRAVPFVLGGLIGFFAGMAWSKR